MRPAEHHTYNPHSSSYRDYNQHQIWSANDQENINYLRPNPNKDNYSSPFSNKKNYRQSSQSQQLDSVQNYLDSRRYDPNFNTKKSYESQQITFLKEKLIETHNKLIKQLDSNNKLTQRIGHYQKELKNAERIIQQLQNQVANCENELEQANRMLSLKTEKTQQKYKSVENRLHDENRRNYQLREQIQSLRSKVMDAVMQKGNLQQTNADLRSDVKNYQQNINDLNEQIRHKTDLIYSKDSEINMLNKKLSQISKDIQDKGSKYEQINNALQSRKQVQQELQHLIKIQQQRNNNLTNDIAFLQKQNKSWQQKLESLSQNYEKQKQEYSWMLNKQDMTNKNLSHEVSRLSQQLQLLNNLYKQAERELGEWKKKPAYDAEKKRRHYEITKQFVNQLESEQQIYGNTMMRNSKPIVASGRSNNTTAPIINIRPPGVGDSRKGSPQEYGRNSTSNSKNHGYFNRSPPSNNKFPTQTSYSQVIIQKTKSNHMSNNVEELEETLITCNMQRKKIKSQIQKIDQLKVKTREMIVKRKRLDDELQYQQEKIKKVKQQLRRLRLA